MTKHSGESRRATPAEEEHRLRSIIDHMADGIVIVNGEGEVRFVNPAAEALFGREATELLGRAFGFPLLAEGSAEIDILRKNGGPVVAELRSTEIEWESEPCILVSLRDITDRKEAEERGRELLREQAARERAEDDKRRFRFLADAGAVLDSSLDYAEVLEQLARLLVSPQIELPLVAPDGMPHPRLADWCVIDVIEGLGEIARVAAVHHDPEKQPLLDELREKFPPNWTEPYPAARALQNGEPILYRELDRGRIEELSRSPEHADLLARIGVASALVVPLVARGEVYGAVTLACSERQYDEADLAFAQDLAQRAGLSLANARLYRAAQEANRAKSDFLAVMSHELRTPLNAIIGYTDLMEAEVSGPLTDKQRENLGRIEDSSHHLLQIVEEILTYARMDAGREEIHTTPTDLTELASEVGSMVEPLALRKGIGFRVEHPPGGLLVETDPGKVRQILLNLLSNAVKFTDSGRVELRVRPDGDSCLLEVSDTGVGIPPEHLERVFEPFWQVEQSATRSAGGTGLGLSVARRLAELLGGSLRVRSTRGEGSTFTLLLPPRAPSGAGPE